MRKERSTCSVRATVRNTQMTETITIHEIPKPNERFDQDVCFAVEHLLYWLSSENSPHITFPTSELTANLKTAESLSGALANTLGIPALERLTLPLVVRRSTAQEVATQLALAAQALMLSHSSEQRERLEGQFLGLVGIICLLAKVCKLYPYQILDDLTKIIAKAPSTAVSNAVPRLLPKMPD